MNGWTDPSSCAISVTSFPSWMNMSMAFHILISFSFFAVSLSLPVEVRTADEARAVALKCEGS